MKKLSFWAVLLPVLFCACSSFNEEKITPIIPTTHDLQAGFADETRTYIENGKYLRWHEDDRLTAFYGNTLNRQYKFNGKTGANSGTFSLVPSGELGTGNVFDRIYAVYPYNETATITEDGKISLTLPAVQSYAENSFGKDANTMIAVTENLEDTFLSFKNACGYLKLELYAPDGGVVKSIEIKGNNNEKIAGAATATIAFGEAPVVTMADDATTSITLDCGDGISLGTTDETAIEFWVTIPETTFTDGITIKATDCFGATFTKSTDKEVKIERNTIQPMATFKFINPNTPTQPTPANNEIWYTATAKVEPYDPDEFGATITSNVWDSDSGKGVITFLANVTKIGYNAFYKCEKLKTITIPNSVTSIGEWVFSYCTSLTSVNIPDSVTDIGRFAFYKCSSLTSVTIPDSVTKIGENAFSYCTSLTAFYGKFATTDNRCLIVNGTLNAFAIGCGATSYTIPDSVTKIGVYAFNKCSSLTSITIPDSVTSIEWHAFEDCTSLTSVNIPDSVTSIGDSAFAGCTSLTSVTIPNSVTKIRSYAFSDCTSLTSVTIPDSVTSIGEGAFKRCTSLKEVYCKPTTPPTGGSSMFSNNASDRKIYVPASDDDSIINAYKAKQYWSDYASYIEEYDFSAGQ